MGQKLTETTEIIEHKEVPIVFNDFSGLRGQQLVDALKATSQAMIPRIKNKKDWVSVNLFTGCVFDEAATKALIRTHKATTAAFIAIGQVGLSPIQESSIELIHSLAKSKLPIRFLDSVEEAKDWVVEIYRQHGKKKD